MCGLTQLEYTNDLCVQKIESVVRGHFIISSPLIDIVSIKVRCGQVRFRKPSFILEMIGAAPPHRGAIPPSSPSPIIVRKSPTSSIRGFAYNSARFPEKKRGGGGVPPKSSQIRTNSIRVGETFFAQLHFELIGN